MKAAQIKDYGPTGNIGVVDIDIPKPGEGQVQVEVHAASLNPVDTSMREGHTRQMADIALPATLGGDIAGIVSAVGEGVETFKVGDKVYGQALALLGSTGAFAEYAVTAADRVALVPTNVTFVEAASLPLVGVSALQALTEHIKFTSGQKLFIHGGSGGIGVAAIQIAKHLGVYVAASAKGDLVEYVKSFGIDEVINTETEDYTAKLKDFDALLTLVYGEDWSKLLSVLKPGSIAVSLVGPADEATATAHSVTVIPQRTDTNTTRLDKLSELVESGVVTPQVAHVYPLDQVPDAFAKREAGGVSGKIVIEIKP